MAGPPPALPRHQRPGQGRHHRVDGPDAGAVEQGVPRVAGAATVDALKDRVGDVDEFVGAVRRVAAGGTAMDAEVIGQLLGRRTAPIARLTPREREVLELIAQGRSNNAIAAALSVSDKAVGKHIGSIFGKLDLLPSDDDNRRVRAVLAYLQAAG